MGKGNGTIPNVQDNEGEGEGNPKAPLHSIIEKNASKKTGHGDHDGDTYYGEDVVKKRRAEIKQAQIDQYRQYMNFPEEIKRTVSVLSGGGGGENTATNSKGSTYNRNSKRGTRLVRSKNG